MSTPCSGIVLKKAACDGIIPIIENRSQFMQLLESEKIGTIFLRYCNLFDLTPLLERANTAGYTIYVNIDQIDGIHPDDAGLTYLAKELHIKGIISNHPKILALGKKVGLVAIQRIFAVDSTGLESSLETVNEQQIDMLDISPAPVIPHIFSQITSELTLPFIGSGLLFSAQQIRGVLNAGATGVAVARPELWL